MENKKYYGIIYKIENLINGKIYIGQTVQGFKKRYESRGEGIERVYNYAMKLKEKGKYYNQYFMEEIEDFGFDNFKVDEIFDVAYSKEELDEKEDYYIELFDSINNGYNKTTNKEKSFSCNMTLTITEKDINDYINHILSLSEDEREKYFNEKEKERKVKEEERRIRKEKEDLMFKYKEMANNFYKNKEYEESEKLFYQAMQLCEEINYKDREVYKRLAISLEKNKKYKECIKICEKARELNYLTCAIAKDNSEKKDWEKRFERVSNKIK